MKPERLARFIEEAAFYRVLIDESLDGLIDCPTCGGAESIYVHNVETEMVEPEPCPNTACYRGKVPIRHLCEEYDAGGDIPDNLKASVQDMIRLLRVTAPKE